MNHLYTTTKTFGTERGFSCCFRQWRADSHCNQLHGYSLGFRFTLESETLDSRNWVYDYGNFKEIKSFLEKYFDHTLVVAADDPARQQLEMLGETGIANVHIFPDVGTEAFAEFVFRQFDTYIRRDQAAGKLNPDVRLVRVDVFEHDSNQASYQEN